ncbi:hypothetical protein NDU88_002146 [Pleurodeles waltl]|uniref:Uncharacterized protein n=1 Tax=Pleurodeles waltl TaxID=8319 RepID=A0AAV7TL01_PLEWA|nr:hypothetical protein NDU88_002146 [Pleurodeles waltl]
MQKGCQSFPSIHADPEEVGVVEQRICENDADPSGVLNPERDKGQEKSFSPGGEDVTKKESRTDGPASELHSRRRRRGGEVPINPDDETAEDVRKERRTGQTGHVLGRTWPGQPVLRCSWGGKGPAAGRPSGSTAQPGGQSTAGSSKAPVTSGPRRRIGRWTRSATNNAAAPLESVAVAPP